MKKTISFTIGIILVIALTVFGISYLLSLHKVSFSLKNNTTSVTIYRSNKQKIKQITSGNHIFLTKGNYYAIPEGSNISKNQIDFSVTNKDMIVSINPDFSTDYLNSLLPKEEPAVRAAITAKYPSVFASYTLAKETLYKQADWFGALLEPKVSDPRDQRDPYHIVLQKQNSTWQVIRRPEYILTSADYKDVPIDVLRAINLIVE